MPPSRLPSFSRIFSSETFSIRTVLRLAFRHARRRPLQSLFLIIGVALGVAMMVAIDLANGSAERAFQLGTETVTGRSTHQISGGPSGLDEAIYRSIRRDLGYRLSAPVVESYVVVDELDAQPMRLLGIDPFAEAPFRSYLGNDAIARTPVQLTELMVIPNTVLLSQSIAERYGIRSGDTLNVRVGAGSQTLQVAGLLEPADDLSRRALDGLLIADISTAQEVLDSVGKLSRIDLIIADGVPGEEALEALSALLPPGVRISPAAGRVGTVNEMTAAFSLNLTALSLLALVVGVFLIYNTVTFSVVQRRPVLGSLRALGMTRREIFAIILTEAALLGALGTAVGLGLGVVLGRGAVQLVTQTMNDLFFVVAVREISIPLFTLVKGAVIGIGAALTGAAIPAYEATSVTPAGAFRRSNVEEKVRRAIPRITAAALMLLALGAALLIPEWNLVIAFGGLFAVILGAALLTPAATLALMQGVQLILNRGAGIIERMAPRTVIRSLSRTSVAVAALMVAVSVIIGVGVMISSFRNTVESWLDEVLQADIFISAPSLASNQSLASLSPDLVAQIAAIPAVTQVATNRTIDIAIFPGGQEQAVAARLAALSNDLAGAQRRYRDSIGDWQVTWNAVEAGAIVVNEPMANRYDIAVGDRLPIQTDKGMEEFEVVGISVDFDVNAVVFMHDPQYRARWDDDRITAIGAFVADDESVDTVVNEIRAAVAGESELLVRSNRGTRQNALEVFDRTFAITIALQLLATMVAFIGILSTLMSLQLERMREIGVLRSTGMTQGQLWRLSLFETSLIGASAGLFAIPTGLLLAVILIYIINLRSFGWTLEMQLQSGQLLQAFAVALLAALLAGIYPAWRMGNAQPADALRAE